MYQFADGSQNEWARGATAVHCGLSGSGWIAVHVAERLGGNSGGRDMGDLTGAACESGEREESMEGTL